MESHSDLVMPGEGTEGLEVAIAVVGCERDEDQKRAGKEIPPALPIKQENGGR